VGVGSAALEALETLVVGEVVGRLLVTWGEELVVGDCVNEVILAVGSNDDPAIVSISVGCSDEDAVPMIEDVWDGEGLCTASGSAELEPLETPVIGDIVGPPLVTCSEELVVGDCVAEVNSTVGSVEDPTIVSI
jgi:hypothetical protein